MTWHYSNSSNVRSTTTIPQSALLYCTVHLRTIPPSVARLEGSRAHQSTVDSLSIQVLPRMKLQAVKHEHERQHEEQQQEARSRSSMLVVPLVAFDMRSSISSVGLLYRTALCLKSTVISASKEMTNGTLMPWCWCKINNHSLTYRTTLHTSLVQ